MLVSRSRTGQAFSLLSLLLSSGVGKFIPLTPSTDRFPLYNTPLHHQFIAHLYASTSSSSHSLSDRFCNACVIEALWCLLITPVNLSLSFSATLQLSSQPNPSWSVPMESRIVFSLIENSPAFHTSWENSRLSPTAPWNLVQKETQSELRS